ncbi:hypothetical protein [Saccharococcus caldoxylosilyticus]|uniref:hypothetical protein n=1 Tax=Saccharococcus caldoxylosilyticus TaxID=81408 RepID=UPI0005AA163C|nr:hypothetical protein [Parageobacillus caldoxylosilyticus]MBB3853971.1 hypothetical protein [Parageobacillus caldoxylosilyticus]OQP04085.1 hypothetical protein BSK33_04095 [Geobacillus sp. 44B]QNU37671.1 hypothetical protein IC801_18595 [Geobacillus sp. 44B]
MPCKTVPSYAVLHIDNTAIHVTFRQVPYDPHHFLLAFEKKNVPARELILRCFVGISIGKKVKHTNCLTTRSLAAAKNGINVFRFFVYNVTLLCYII